MPTKRTNNPEYITALNSDETNVQIGKQFNISEHTVRMDKKRLNIAPSTAGTTTQPIPNDELTGKADVNKGGGEFVDVKVTEPIKDWTDVFTRFNLDPNEFEILGDTVRMSTWEQSKRTDNGDRDVVRLYSYRAQFVRTRPKADNIDPVALLANLRATTSTQQATRNATDNGDTSAFVLSINDIQLGQSYNGGSARVIEQFHGFIAKARQRINELRKIGRRLETLVIIGGGDLVEGCVIYPNQAFSLDLDRKQQLEGVIALLLHTIDELGPTFDRIKVLAARGNHGENRINGKYTTLSDNDDTHAFEMAKLALSRDPEYRDKIEWTIAEAEAGVWCEVYDWTLATTHGDVYAKGVAGATIDKKAHAWYKNMAAARKRFGRLGQADVLITHHFHHDKMSDWGDCFWRQTPSQDNGSPYFEMATGEYSHPGMLTFVMTPDVRYSDEEVLRLTA